MSLVAAEIVPKIGFSCDLLKASSSLPAPAYISITHPQCSIVSLICTHSLESKKRFLIKHNFSSGHAPAFCIHVYKSIGNVFSSLIHFAMARNLSSAKQSFGYAILGLALTEAIASFAPMMVFLIPSVF
ncbi:LOW QUALITY PROTEIN: uncharacterized protein [Malus domestica]|uniref:LOW QUALITY PROTEIN: uncharacterized protein n=1 Tax=Malus domestica TaxID=3750 RepID=UPI0039767958